MDSEQVIRIVLTVITPILTAGIGIAALVIGDWRERRTQAGRRKQVFEDAGRQVDFAAQWFNASTLITDSPEAQQHAAARAQAWLDEASELVTESKPPPPADMKRSVTVRRLLLAYPMHHRGARVLRAFYYFFLGVIALQISGALGSAFGRTDTLGVADYLSRGLLFADLISIVTFTLIAMGFRYWSLRVEETPLEASARGRLTLRDALLLYKVNGAGAVVARLVFHCWVLLTVLVIADAVITSIDDPKVLPANVVALVAWVGWAVGLRYWAVSRNERAAA